MATLGSSELGTTNIGFREPLNTITLGSSEIGTASLGGQKETNVKDASFTAAAKTQAKSTSDDLTRQTTSSVSIKTSSESNQILKVFVNSLAIGNTQAIFSTNQRNISILSKYPQETIATFRTPAIESYNARTTDSVSLSDTTKTLNDPLFVATSESSGSSDTELLFTSTSSLGIAQTSTNRLKVIEITDNLVGKDTTSQIDYQQQRTKVNYNMNSDEITYEEETDEINYNMKTDKVTYRNG